VTAVNARETCAELSTMTVDVFEESKLTLTAWIARGKGDRAKAKFEFEQKGGAETVEAAELELGGKKLNKKKVSTTITLPKCKDDEDFYTLSYKVNCEGKEYPGGDFKVWLKTATFKAVNKEDGSDLAGVPIEFSQKKEPLLRTNDKGESPLPINGAAPFTVVAKAPCWIEKWTTEVGRLREAEVSKRTYTALLSYPPPEDNAEDKPHKQYVNLKADPKAPNQGSVLTVTVGAQAADKCIPGPKDEEVYVKVEFDANNSKRNSPEPSITVGGTVVKPTKGVAEGKVPYNDKGVAEFTVQLGQAGGDKVKVSVGVTPACEDGTVYIENWRKLWYQLTVPKGAAEPSLARMVGALGEVFVEYIKEGKTVELAEDEGPAGSWFPGKWLKDAGTKYLNIGNHNKAYFHGKFVDTKTPHQVHVLCCHTQYDAKAASCETDVTLTLDSTNEATWSDGTKVKGKDYHAGSGFFPKSLKDGTSSLISGSWEADDGSVKGKIEDADVWVDDYDNHGWITVKLPDDAKTYVEAKAGNKVEVEMTLHVSKGPYLGEADGASKWLQLIVFKSAENVVNDVMAHELGHTMKQVPQSAGGKPPGLAAVVHGRHYTGNEHQGGHCADGMSSANYNGGAGKVGSDYAGDFSGKSECTCIMYGENGEGSTCAGKFCSRCQPFIKAEALASLH
jgi:hypothetical protein